MKPGSCSRQPRFRRQGRGRRICKKGTSLCLAIWEEGSGYQILVIGFWYSDLGDEMLGVTSIQFLKSNISSFHLSSFHLLTSPSRTPPISYSRSLSCTISSRLVPVMA